MRTIKERRLADFRDTKYGTNLAINWTSTDTKTTFDLGNKVCGEYRDEPEGGDKAKEVESEA